MTQHHSAQRKCINPQPQRTYSSEHEIAVCPKYKIDDSVGSSVESAILGNEILGQT